MADTKGPNGPIDPEVEVDSSAVLATLSKAEIDVQIATAKQWPRSLENFKNDAMYLATLDEKSAGSMFYRLPRDGKTIEGPSVRLAEVVASCWGNLRQGGRIIDVGEDFVTAQGMAFDLEKNNATTIEVRRRIKDKYGRRYSMDMIGTTANAAMSIALRNAIFKVVPLGLVKGIMEEAKQVSLGKKLTMAQKQQKAVEAFGKIGATEKEMLLVVKRKHLGDLNLEDLITLRGILTAIEDRETTWTEVLQQAQTTEERMSTSIDNVADVIPDKPKKVEPEIDDPAIGAAGAKQLREVAESMGLDGAEADVAARELGFKKLADVPASRVSEVAAKLEETTT